MATKKLQEFTKSAKKANALFHFTMNPFDNAMAKQFEKDQILGAKLFTANSDVNLARRF